jgi:hypothetical protein
MVAASSPQPMSQLLQVTSQHFLLLYPFDEGIHPRFYLPGILLAVIGFDEQHGDVLFLKRSFDYLAFHLVRLTKLQSVMQYTICIIVLRHLPYMTKSSGIGCKYGTVNGKITVHDPLCHCFKDEINI